MDQRVKLLVGAGIVLLVLITLGVFFFLSRVAPGPQTAENTSLDSLPTVRVTPPPTNTGSSEPADLPGKLFKGLGFTLRYPEKWGLLTCTNSKHFELDPTSAKDTSISCDRAAKPVTVLVVDKLNCQGDLVALGNKQVLKSKMTASDGDVSYRWCVNVAGTEALDITHRVSQIGSPSSSKEDFSSQVEEMIKTINPTPQGS